MPLNGDKSVQLSYNQKYTCLSVTGLKFLQNKSIIIKEMVSEK